MWLSIASCSQARTIKYQSIVWNTLILYTTILTSITTNGILIITRCEIKRIPSSEASFRLWRIQEKSLELGWRRCKDNSASKRWLWELNTSWRPLPKDVNFYYISWRASQLYELKEEEESDQVLELLCFKTFTRYSRNTMIHERIWHCKKKQLKYKISIIYIYCTNAKHWKEKWQS